MSVYITLVSDNIPHNSEPIAILTRSLLVKMIICSVITLTVALIGLIYNNDCKKSIPKIFKMFLTSKQNKVNVQTKDEVVVLKPDANQTRKTNTESNSDHSVTWSKVGQVFDRIAFVGFAIAIINVYRLLYRAEIL